jgi:hypothetical protein
MTETPTSGKESRKREFSILSPTGDCEINLEKTIKLDVSFSKPAIVCTMADGEKIPPWAVVFMADVKGQLGNLSKLKKLDDIQETLTKMGDTQIAMQNSVSNLTDKVTDLELAHTQLENDILKSEARFCSIERHCAYLDRELARERAVNTQLEYKLKKTKPKKIKLYSKFNGKNAINHTRIRLGLSGLKSQRCDYNHVDNRRCDFCGAKKDDAMHYLLQCSVFTTMRNTLLNSVINLYESKSIALDLRRTIVQKELVKNMLCGDPRLSEAENVDLFGMVQQFIGSSKRF